MRVFNRYISPRGLTVFAFELVLIAGSVVYAMHLHGGVDAPWRDLEGVPHHRALPAVVLLPRSLRSDRRQFPRELLVRLLQASGSASLVLAALYVAFPRLIIGHGVLASSVLFFVVAVTVWRLLFLQVGRRAALQEHVLIVGTSASARIVAREVLDQHDYAYTDRRVHRRRPGRYRPSIVNPR